MGGMVERLKPSATARVHLLAAALLWSTVGVGLLAAGTVWTFRGAPWARWALPVALAVGLAKSWLVIDRSAVRIADRIEARGDGRCLGGFLSPGTWAIVLTMMVGGRLLRASALPRHWIGLLYVAVGAALLRSSRIPWSRWHGLAGPEAGP